MEAAASNQPSGAALEAGLSFSASLSLFTAGCTFFPKGVFRYKSHEEANQHAAECLADGMAALAKDVAMDEIAQAATPEDLKTLLRSLDVHGVEYLLIGGYALAAHGYQRATTDIDLMVASTVDAGQRMKDALMVLPDQAAKDIDPGWFTEGDNIRVGDAIIVDIMLNANGQTYDTLKQFAQTVDYDGIAVRS